MLVTILKTEKAIQQSIYIMRSLKEMKHYITENHLLLNNTELLRLTNHVIEQDKRTTNIESSMVTKLDIDNIMDKILDDTTIKEIVFLDGQKFDAVEAYINIYKQVKQSIYIVDDYISIDTLSLLKHEQKRLESLYSQATRSKID